MTLYYNRVLSSLFNRSVFVRGGYKHFNSYLDQFYEDSDKYRVSSVNNHALDLSRLGDFRISRFVRDPRDLVVSGYFYHKRGAEPWCNDVHPRPEDWAGVNGNIPEGMDGSHSFSTYLQSLSKEDGLIAEIVFRKNHFRSMSEWPTQHANIKIVRYEDIVGSEKDMFREIFDFYELGRLEKIVGLRLVNKYSAQKQSKRSKHIRNPAGGQWKEHFTPKVTKYFEERYGDVLAMYGYA